MFDKAIKLKIETTEIKNVEILATGTFTDMFGRKVTIKQSDFKDFITNFKDGVLEPFLNLNHDDKFTDKVKKVLSVVALGFVSQLSEVGNKLVADFKQVPIKVAELIESGALKKRSAEFFQRGFKVDGKVFNNVLKAVSFFGADIPAINNLSNDFDILLKSEDYAVSFSNENGEATKILFQKE